MIPWDQAPADVLREMRGVFFDIDDTFSSKGKITAQAYDALWRAREGGLALVPVTGRPAGWADHIARMWPVDAVVAENGALAMSLRDGRMQTLHLLDEETRRAHRSRLDVLQRQILEQVPGTALASDQAYRLFDLAIDFCEDVSPLPQTEIDRIVALFEQAGATAKISSIHVNGWFGKYDKLGMCRHYASEVLGVDLDEQCHRYLFAGDSPNDSPMFAFFPHAVGVANVCDFGDRLSAAPRYVTDGRCGQGFVQVIDRLLQARKAIF